MNAFRGICGLLSSPLRVGRGCACVPMGTRLFSSAPKDKLLLTLASPSEAFYVSTPVDSVILPGREGAFAVTNNHAPTVSMLKAGEVIVKKDNDEAKYFLSDGFAFVNPPRDDSGCCVLEVMGVECVPSSTLDKEKAAQVLQQLLQQNAQNSDEWTKAKTLLGQDLLSSVIRAAQ